MAPPRLRDLGERRIVAELLRPRYGDQSSFGDDCAAIAIPSDAYEVVLTTDPCPFPLVSALGWDSLYYWGWLLATINLSDLAAAGAEPAALLTSYTLSPDLPVHDFEALLSGVDDCCAEQGARVVGGNIKDGSFQLTATALGWCQRGRRLGRTGARPGNVAVLIGHPGMLWAFALIERGFATVTAEDHRALTNAAIRPRAKTHAAGALAARGLVRAAIDVSDGAYAALAELCRTNHCGVDIHLDDLQLPAPVADVARQASVDTVSLVSLWGDWSLVVAVEERDVDECVRVVEEKGEQAWVLGAFTRRREMRLTSRDGSARTWHGNEFERFGPDSWSDDMLQQVLSDLVDSATR